MKFLIALLIPAFAFGAPSSQREITADHIKNGSATLALPTSSDTLVGRSTADTLTNKNIAASTNTITGLTNGNFSSSAAIDFSKLATLTSGNILVGNGSAVASSVTPSGDLTMANTGAFTLNTVTIAKGGTNNASLPVTAGGTLYTDGTKVQNTGPGASGTVLLGGTTPAYGTLAVPTVQKFTTNSGSVIGSWIYFSGTVSFAAGDTYTDGSAHGYTALQTCSSCTGDGYFSTATGAAVAIGTLTKISGSGSSTITVLGSGPLQAYVPTSGTKLVKVTLGGGGGSGGSCTTTNSSQGSCSSGGGGGALAIKWFSNPSGTIYYGVGVGGVAPSAGTNGGLRGGLSTVIFPSTLAVTAEGGYPGLAGGTTTLSDVVLASASEAQPMGPFDISAQGNPGTPGYIINSANAVAGGNGGSGPLGGGAGTASGFANYIVGTAGGGGAGCGLFSSQTQTAGGAGGNGFAIFEEFTQ